mgnify:CR=1 FL=1
MREFKVTLSDEVDDLDWIIECIGNVLSKYLPGDWYDFEEIDQ